MFKRRAPIKEHNFTKIAVYSANLEDSPYGINDGIIYIRQHYSGVPCHIGNVIIDSYYFTGIDEWYLKFDDVIDWYASKVDRNQWRIYLDVVIEFVNIRTMIKGIIRRSQCTNKQFGIS